MDNDVHNKPHNVIMKTGNELMFREFVTISYSDGREVDGVNICFVREMDENETLEDVDTSEEYEELMGGTTNGDLFETKTLPDGSIEYTLVEEYDDYDSWCEYEFFVVPYNQSVEG